MRIALLIKAFLPWSVGGIQVNVYYLARELAGRGHRVTVFTRKPRGANPHEGFTVEDLPSLYVGRRMYHLFPGFYASRIARSLLKRVDDFDVFHGQEIWSSLPLACSAGLLRKSVVTVHGAWPFCGQGYKFMRRDMSLCAGCDPAHLSECLMVWRENIFLRPLYKRLFHRQFRFRLAQFQKFDRVITVSRFFADLIRKQTGKTAMVISNAIDEDWVAEPQVARGSGNILYTGRMIEWKGIDVLLKAFAAVRERMPCTLIIAGPRNRRYEKAASEMGIAGSVQFRGSVDLVGMKKLYQEADVVVLPSIVPESFGRSIAEGMALGKPVVGTKVGALPELITDGVNGYLVPPADSDALADRLISLLADPDRQRNFGARGREFIKKCCLSGYVAEQHENIYRDITGASA